MTLLQKLIARQKAEKEEAAKRREARLAKRRAARVARESAQQSGLDDLPVEVAVAIEENAAQSSTQAEPVRNDDSVENLISRLEAIRERIWRLRAMFAVSLSHDCAVEADRYLQLFQTLAEQLKARDAAAFDDLVRGHESLLLCSPVPVKQTIPLDVQRFCEIRWEAQQSPTRSTPRRPADSIGDGLSWML